MLLSLRNHLLPSAAAGVLSFLHGGAAPTLHHGEPLVEQEKETDGGWSVYRRGLMVGRLPVSARGQRDAV